MIVTIQSMGCGSSVKFKEKNAALIQLSAAQKYLVRETWELVEQRRSYVGKKTFLT